MMPRFMEKVAVGPGCWEWLAFKNRDGYGLFWFKGGKITAHRYAYLDTHGSIPKGLHILHACDNPGCVKPAHLFAGTNADNMRDRDQKGRTQRGGKHYRAKLTREDVLEIRSSGESGPVLAKTYGVTKENINCIRRRDTWKHI